MTAAGSKIQVCAGDGAGVAGPDYTPQHVSGDHSSKSEAYGATSASGETADVIPSPRAGYRAALPSSAGGLSSAAQTTPGACASGGFSEHTDVALPPPQGAASPSAPALASSGPGATFRKARHPALVAHALRKAVEALT